MLIIKTQLQHILLLLGTVCYCCLLGCTNDTLLGDDDTFTPTDTISGVVCNPDTIYFELEVLPILKSNCGRSDCHNAGQAWAGIKMENYITVMETGGIRPFMPEETRIFKQITHDDEEERMPPQPYNRLSQRQVEIIRDWINQGANNFRCDSATIPCPTDGVSYAADIAPVIADACYGCHNQYVHEGGIELLDYEDLYAVAIAGSLVGTISGEPAYVRMPFGSVRLSECHIAKIKAWVGDGAPEN